MREPTPETITDAVLDRMATSNPRSKVIVASAVIHRHAFPPNVNIIPYRELATALSETSGRVGIDPAAIIKRSRSSEKTSA